MNKYVACVATMADSVEGQLCDLAVVKAEHVGDTAQGDPAFAGMDEVVFGPVELPVSVDDPDRLEMAPGKAVEALAANGWTVTGEWSTSHNAIYAWVEEAS